MPDQWFNVPAESVDEGDGHGPIDLPKYREQSDGWSGFMIADSPRFVVRYYGSNLDEIASNSDVSKISDADAADLLNNVRSKTWSGSEVNQSFEVS